MYITKRHCNCAVYVYCIYLRNGAGKIQYIFLLDCYPAVYILELSSKLKTVCGLKLYKSKWITKCYRQQTIHPTHSDLERQSL